MGKTLTCRTEGGIEPGRMGTVMLHGFWAELGSLPTTVELSGMVHIHWLGEAAWLPPLPLPAPACSSSLGDRDEDRGEGGQGQRDSGWGGLSGGPK